MNSLEEIKQNNKGLSLVELIVAISIGVIVSGTIAALLIFSIRMYRNESVNTSMQYELQSNLNMMMDEIMGSQTVVVVQNKDIPIDHVNTKGSVKQPYTRCALFGKFEDMEYDDAEDLGEGGVPKKKHKVKYSGVVFASGAADTGADSDGRFKVYMNRVKDVTGTDPKAVMAKCYKDIKDSFATDPNPYLLGDNLVQFVIDPNLTGTTYTNPISVKVKLSFERNGWGEKKYNKHVDDVTYLRNKVDGISLGSKTIPSVYLGTLSGDDIASVIYTEYELE